MVQLEARPGGINPEPIIGIPLIHPRTLSWAGFQFGFDSKGRFQAGEQQL
ncbi:MAG: hypothetical protein OXG30_04725 [bacterium]|nr:hypothetical protein [bacterium]